MYTRHTQMMHTRFTQTCTNYADTMSKRHAEGPTVLNLRHLLGDGTNDFPAPLLAVCNALALRRQEGPLAAGHHPPPTNHHTKCFKKNAKTQLTRRKAAMGQGTHANAKPQPPRQPQTVAFPTSCNGQDRVRTQHDTSNTPTSNVSQEYCTGPRVQWGENSRWAPRGLGAAG